QELHGVLGGHGARRRRRARAAHEVIGRGPVGVAIEQRPRDTAGERPLESLVVLLRVPDRDDVVAARQSALYAQTLVIARAAAEARAVRCVCVLERLAHHGMRLIGTIGACAASGGERASSTRSIPGRSRTRTATVSAISLGSLRAWTI